MALIKCSNCGQLISDKANKCPKCGMEIQAVNNNYQQQPMQGYQQPMQGYQQPMQGYQQPMQGYQQPMQGYQYQQPYQNYQQGPRITCVYSMSFGNAISNCFNQFADFSGRARRKEYWYFVLFNMLMSIGLFVAILAIVNVSKIDDAQALNILQIVFGIWNTILFVPSLAVFWRRMHDIGKSGGWFFINFIPIVGWIISLVFLCRAGNIGTNDYDDDPKYEIEY